jgi:hypothetical protein
MLAPMFRSINQALAFIIRHSLYEQLMDWAMTKCNQGDVAVAEGFVTNVLV